MQHEGYAHGFQIDADHSLHIYRGSLVRVQADALVSSDDNYLSARGGVSRALADVAGADVAREREQIVREHRPRLGEVVRTSGGALPCRYIYHAITIDDDRGTTMDEAALRNLIANLLVQATSDGVRSLGLPALGVGVASFELGRASEIIIEELLVRLVDTPIQRVTLTLMGDQAERLFYERLVRAQVERLASFELRRRESALSVAAEQSDQIQGGVLQILVSNQKEHSPIRVASGPIVLGRAPKSGERTHTIQDDYCSAQQLEIEALPEGRVRLKNLSSRVVVALSSGGGLDPGATCESPLPLRLKAGKTVIEIELGCCEMDASESFVTIPQPIALRRLVGLDPLAIADTTLAKSATEWPAASTSGLTDVPGMERLTRWFDTVVTAQRAAASSDAFCQETARAMVDLIGLDCGLVLSRRSGEWKPEACYPSELLSSMLYSQAVLEKVGRERRTYFRNIKRDEATTTLSGVSTLVASPVFDNDSSAMEVVGAVYGVRFVQPSGVTVDICPLEAQLVQVLAGLVSAGLARSEQESFATTAQPIVWPVPSPQEDRVLSLDKTAALSTSIEDDIAPVQSEPAAGPAAKAEEAGAAVGEIIEQFPKLIDEAKLSSLPPGRPRLVDGLSELILRHADADDVERELLSSPACRGFRGTLKQRLMEFLYLSEDHLRKALGPALFKNKDLRRMASELGEDSDLPRDQDQLFVVILRSLCFNTLAPPEGIGEYIARLERLLSELRGDSGERTLVAAAIEAGKILEHALKDLLRLYGCFFFGIDFEAELLRRRLVTPRRDGNHVSRLTIGQALEALEQLNSLMNRDGDLRAKWRTLGRSADELLPRRMGSEQTGQGTDCRQVLRAIITARNDSVHTGDTIAVAEPDEMVQRIQRLHAFFCTCQAGGVYPDVLRYEGTFENRNGERFVYFLDEKGRERKVRTDDKIDARRHYYCFATNNPIHLHPTLIPKLH